MIQSLRAKFETHQSFLIVFLLFVSFRFLAIMLFRPGGFIADNSDYEFYYAWGLLTPQGYRAYDNLWTAYPPLFPLVMLNVFEWSSRIPPWIDPRLFFHTLFGLTLLLFESGNLILIHRISNKLICTGTIYRTPVKENRAPIKEIRAPLERNRADHGLAPPTLYALLFVPVYTLIGWFESMPLFFMLLGLDLLIRRGKVGIYGSALTAALGFLTKLTPMLLVPIAVRWLGSKFSLDAARTEWFNKRSSGNLLRPIIYTLIFFGTIIAVGIVLIPDKSLAFNSFTVQGMRPPWQSIWALIDGEGFYGYGLVPVDMRNLIAFDERRWQSQLPWTAITMAFIALYLWLYTRRYDWSNPRTPVAFAAISVIWLFLYSKGWSPQFLLWILAFIVLLLPTLRGVLVAIALSIGNFIESNIFLILLPDEHWIMWGTVLLRTGLLILLALEFLGQIWPIQERDRQKTPSQENREGKLRRFSAMLTYLLLLAAMVGTVASLPRAASAYQARRFAESPCSAAITFLHEQAVWSTDTIISDQPVLWQELYPWLHRAYEFHIIDTYSPVDQPAEEVAAERLTQILEEKERDGIPNSTAFWWVTKEGAATTSRQPNIMDSFFERPTIYSFDPQTFGSCTLQRVYTNLYESRIAITSELTPDQQGGPIQLQKVDVEREVAAGEALYVELYWLTETPLTESYTVFTQLIDPSGALVAQQDNLPVEGLAPTNTWQPNAPIRDPYWLEIPADAVAGEYRLLVGLYNEAGRLMLEQRDGSGQDFVEVQISIQ